MVQYYSKQTTKRIPVGIGNKVIGFLEGNKFIKYVQGSKHRLRCPSAWALQAEVFDSVIKLNAAEIIVIDKETNIEYRCSVEVFDKHKGVLDRGFGKQYFLTLNQWEVNHARPR
jgi:hypothetical protein